jgi:hypothetical protein
MTKILKIVTIAEEIMAGIEEKNEKVLLSNPMRIILTPDGVGMVPLSPFSGEKHIEVSKDKVIYVTTPEVELQNEYNAKFGGIIAPPKIKLA